MDRPDISFDRIWAVLLKELIQMRRDRLTFAMMIMLPIVQLVLFGYAINNDPRHLPAAVELREDGPLTRSFLASLRASTFVDIVAVTHNPDDGDRMLSSGEISLLVVIPEGFERRVIRGERPQLLIAVDASDPVASGGVISGVGEIARRAFDPEFQGPLAYLQPTPPPYEIVVHRRFNPAGVTAVNIVPGLLAVILTMTLVMITSIALTRESERGTMEMLLATPLRPSEVMIGKTVPYIGIGAVQTMIVVLAGALLFHIPFSGSWLAFLVGTSAFIIVNLMLGYLISTLVRTQMQAMQTTFLILLPSLLMSGFLFPFRAMPGWAQAIGEMLPITHFLRIVREVMLKDAGFVEIWGDLWPLLAILLVLSVIALGRFRRTLD
jgi:ABC-2 type transport system permease protein